MNYELITAIILNFNLNAKNFRSFLKNFFRLCSYIHFNNWYKIKMSDKNCRKQFKVHYME